MIAHMNVYDAGGEGEGEGRGCRGYGECYVGFGAYCVLPDY